METLGLAKVMLKYLLNPTEQQQKASQGYSEDYVQLKAPATRPGSLQASADSLSVPGWDIDFRHQKCIILISQGE